MKSKIKRNVVISDGIKGRFGEAFRDSREALRSSDKRKDGSAVNRGVSRREMGLKLGISPKTIQSWEMGRTFIEDLSLIPRIRAAYGIDVVGLLRFAVESGGL